MTLNELLVSVPEQFRDAPLIMNTGHPFKVFHLIQDESENRVVVLEKESGVIPPLE